MDIANFNTQDPCSSPSPSYTHSCCCCCCFLVLIIFRWYSLQGIIITIITTIRRIPPFLFLLRSPDCRYHTHTHIYSQTHTHVRQGMNVLPHSVDSRLISKEKNPKAASNRWDNFGWDSGLSREGWTRRRLGLRGGREKGSWVNPSTCVFRELWGNRHVVESTTKCPVAHPRDRLTFCYCNTCNF